MSSDIEIVVHWPCGPAGLKTRLIQPFFSSPLHPFTHLWTALCAWYHCWNDAVEPEAAQQLRFTWLFWRHRATSKKVTWKSNTIRSKKIIYCSLTDHLWLIAMFFVSWVDLIWFSAWVVGQLWLVDPDSNTDGLSDVDGDGRSHAFRR